MPLGAERCFETGVVVGHLLPPRGEVSHDIVRYASDLAHRHALVRCYPRDPQRASQFGFEHRCVERAGCMSVVEDRLAIERAPLAVGAMNSIEDGAVSV